MILGDQGPPVGELVSPEARHTTQVDANVEECEVQQPRLLFAPREPSALEVTCVALRSSGTQHCTRLGQLDMSTNADPMVVADCAHFCNRGRSDDGESNRS